MQGTCIPLVSLLLPPPAFLYIEFCWFICFLILIILHMGKCLRLLSFVQNTIWIASTYKTASLLLFESIKKWTSFPIRHGTGESKRSCSPLQTVNFPVPLCLAWEVCTLSRIFLPFHDSEILWSDSFPYSYSCLCAISEKLVHYCQGLSL